LIFIEITITTEEQVTFFLAMIFFGACLCDVFVRAQDHGAPSTTSQLKYPTTSSRVDNFQSQN